MLQPVIEVEKVLKAEKKLYEEILELEQNKSDAIMNKDGKKLEEIAARQEFVLSEIDRQEKKRVLEIEKYIKQNNLHDHPDGITLRSIITSMDEDSSHHLLVLGMDLKKLILEIKSIKETNETLLYDNLEFFKILLSGLKSEGSIDSGYGKNGKEDAKISNSVLFNQTA